MPRTRPRICGLLVVATTAVMALIPAQASADPPELTVPPDTTVEATGADGALVTFDATSDSGAAISVNCTPPSGSVFALGPTSVTCVAVDQLTGEQSTSAFDITVVDTTPPVFDSYPQQVITRVAGVHASTVDYALPTAHDLVDGTVPVSCQPPSGSIFRFGSTRVSCQAQDMHGNASTSTFDVVVLDQTPPPAVSKFVASVRGKAVMLTWRTPKTADSTRVEVSRQPGIHGARTSVIYRGTGSAFRDAAVVAGVRYTYTATTVDPGGTHSAAATVRAMVPLPTLFAPADRAVVSSPPLLRWAATPHASYYNVQLYLNGKKVLSAWPRSNRLGLTRTWVYNGQRHTLSRGNYVWYVWPGFGPLAGATYGRLLGRSRFSVN